MSDFTWYLRNLLLVKTSEHAEEVLDVSTENLQALLEESEMIESDTLMRYIRVFSELSSQLRYATQKRVMVEIGLIKLCRPAMETNLDSVLDRLRVLEEKMERGVPVIAAQGVTEGISYGEGGSSFVEETEREPDVKPEKAAPEDLQKIKNNWKMIVGQTEGMFKSFLSTAVPKYNGNTGENKLFVEFTNDLAQNCVEDPAKKELLEALITRQIGKSVEVEMLLKKRDSHKELAEISVDDILKQAVHMDIVVEDEPDEE